MLRRFPVEPSTPTPCERTRNEAAQLLKVLANGQRLRVLCLLVDEELSVGQINDRIDLSQSALSQHLAMLREEGLVTTRREANRLSTTA